MNSVLRKSLARVVSGQTRNRTQFGIASLDERINHHFTKYPTGHIVCGRRPGPGDIKLSTNDYLALSRDRRILESQLGALTTLDSEVYMSGVYMQYLDDQRELEGKFAEFLDAEDAALCQSGFAANEGLIQSLADEHTPVYLDMLAHASLWQGALAAQAPRFTFRHNDPIHLQRRIREHGRGIVAVDAVYSTIGDICPLEDILAVCESEGCPLVVDESHSIAVFGEEGRGLVHMLGLQGRIPFRVFSLSKAFVGRGGVIAASAKFIEYFRYESRPAIFSSVVLPWEIARFSRTLDVIRSEDERRQRLFAMSEKARRELCNIGYDVRCSNSQIVPLIAGTEERTARVRDSLESRGVFGSVFTPPATPAKHSLVRLCLNDGLSDADVDRVIQICADIREYVRPEEWPSSMSNYGQTRRVGPLNGDYKKT